MSDPSALNPPFDEFIRDSTLSDQLASEPDTSIFFGMLVKEQSPQASGILSSIMDGYSAEIHGICAYEQGDNSTCQKTIMYIHMPYILKWAFPP